MVSLGQTGSDTITHIVSLATLLGLGLGFPAILVIGHVTLDTVAIGLIAGVETVVAIMSGYYAAKYTSTPTGGVSIITNPPARIATTPTTG